VVHVFFGSKESLKTTFHADHLVLKHDAMGDEAMGFTLPLLGTGWAMESGAVLMDLLVGIREMKN